MDVSSALKLRYKYNQPPTGFYLLPNFNLLLTDYLNFWSITNNNTVIRYFLIISIIIETFKNMIVIFNYNKKKNLWGDFAHAKKSENHER